MPLTINRRLLSLLSIFTLLLVLGGCSSLPAVSSSEDDAFAAFTESLFIEEVTSNTINLHYTLASPSDFGIDSYNISLGSCDPDNMEKGQLELEGYYHTLSSFNYDKLSSENQLTYDILTMYFDNEISAADLSLYSSVLGSTIGTQAQLPVLLAEYTFEREQDIEDYLSILSCMPSYYESIVKLEEAKAEEGLFMSDEIAQGIIEQCQTFIDNPQENYLLDVFNEKLDAFEGLSEEQKEEYKTRNSTELYTHVIPAYQTLINGLSSLLGTGENDKGLCYFENGTAYYEYLVKHSTGAYESIDELQRRVNQQLVSDYTAMQEIIAEHPDVLTSLYTTDLESQEPELILSQLKDAMAKDFPAPPEVNFEVKYVHESLEDFLSPAFYLTPPIDQMTENVIYINQASGYDNISLFTTLAHEGYPGHLYQTVYFSNTEPDSIRNLLGFGGYTEGWATYVEMYSYQLADMDQNLASLLQLNQSITLCIYSTLDIGIHYSGWTREEAASYLEEFGYADPDTANAIYDAVLEAPANYLKYYIGYLKFVDLQNTASEALQAEFDLKDFHEFLLELGPAQFPVIEKYLEIYIEERLPSKGGRSLLLFIF